MWKLAFLCALMIVLAGCGEPRIEPPSSNPFSSDWSAGFDTLFLWSNAISLLMVAVCIAVIIWAPIPTLKNWAYVFLTVAAILLGCGMVFAVVKPFIPWIVLGLIGIMLLIGLWFIIVNFHLLRKVIRLDTDEYEGHLTKQEQKIVEQCQLPTIKH